MNNNTISKSYYNEIVNKIIELSLISLNKESKCWIDIICTKIKVCELQKQHLQKIHYRNNLMGLQLDIFQI